MTDDRTWERLGAAAGIGFVVLFLLATFLYPQQPRIDSDPAVTLAWVHKHRAALETGMILGLFASGLFVWFAAHLRTVLDKAGRLTPVIFGSGIAIAVTGTLGAVPICLLGIMDAQGSIQTPDVVRMLGDSTQVLYGLVTIMAVVFLTALGVTMLRKELVAPWLGWVALVVAVLNGISTVTSMSFATYHGAGWAIPGWGSFLGFLFVVLVTSVSLLRTSSSTAPRRPAVMAAA